MCRNPSQQLAVQLLTEGFQVRVLAEEPITSSLCLPPDHRAGRSRLD